MNKKGGDSLKVNNISEEIIYKLTKRHFYDLYVFLNPKFKVDAGENEIADVLILVGKVIISIQVKERSKQKGSKDKDSWFQKKVIKEANKQHNDTLQYLLSQTITFKNQSEEKSIKYNKSEHKIQFITIFENNEINEYKRYHNSKTLGEYPIFSLDDFSLVCKDLLTPIDILNFIPFRMKLVKEYEKMIPRPMIIEVTYDDMHTGLVQDYSDANLITMFIIRSELIDKTADAQTTQRFMRYIDELIEHKKGMKQQEEINAVNYILEVYSKMCSIDVKIFFENVDDVVMHSTKYGIMRFLDSVVIIVSNLIYCEEKNFIIFQSELKKQNIDEFIWVVADESNIGTTLMKIDNN